MAKAMMGKRTIYICEAEQFTATKHGILLAYKIYKDSQNWER